jgi:ABC-type multidrug transport system fused ATPase/permease subunit
VVGVRLEPVSFAAVVKFLISNSIAPGSVLRVLIRQDERNSKEETQMSEQNSVVAVYKTHVEAEEAVKQLQRAGTDMRKLSVVGKDTHADEQVVGYYNAGDRMKYWGKNGAFWGGFWGLLFGSAFFAIPGIGPILAAGPVVAWIVGALEGAVLVGGVSALGAGLYSIGIPKDSVIQYDLAIKTDKFLLLVHGTASEVEKAREILAGTQPLDLKVHSAEIAELAAR